MGKPRFLVREEGYGPENDRRMKGYDISITDGAEVAFSLNPCACGETSLEMVSADHSAVTTEWECAVFCPSCQVFGPSVIDAASRAQVEIAAADAWNGV